MRWFEVTDSRLTFKSLSLQDLAAGLVLKLIILTQKVVTKRAAEDTSACSTDHSKNTSQWLDNDLNTVIAVWDHTITRCIVVFKSSLDFNCLYLIIGKVEIPTVLPHAAVAFNAICVRQGTWTGVRAQTLPSMAHPGLAEVTYSSLVDTKKEETLHSPQLPKYSGAHSQYFRLNTTSVCGSNTTLYNKMYGYISKGVIVCLHWLFFVTFKLSLLFLDFEVRCSVERRLLLKKNPTLLEITKPCGFGKKNTTSPSSRKLGFIYYSRRS